MAAHVELAGTRATGIRLLDGTVIEADRVVLAAGTYASPMILARSGIGPAAELQALGIDCPSLICLVSVRISPTTH